MNPFHLLLNRVKVDTFTLSYVNSFETIYNNEYQYILLYSIHSIIILYPILLDKILFIWLYSVHHRIIYMI